MKRKATDNDENLPAETEPADQASGQSVAKKTKSEPRMSTTGTSASLSPGMSVIETSASTLSPTAPAPLAAAPAPLAAAPAPLAAANNTLDFLKQLSRLPVRHPDEKANPNAEPRRQQDHADSYRKIDDSPQLRPFTETADDTKRAVDVLRSFGDRMPSRDWLQAFHLQLSKAWGTAKFHASGQPSKRRSVKHEFDGLWVIKGPRKSRLVIIQSLEHSSHFFPLAYFTDHSKYVAFLVKLKITWWTIAYPGSWGPPENLSRYFN